MALKKSSMDLTQGSIPRLIAIFALPLLLSQLFQNLYNSVDSIIVGRFVGTTALAAVSSCGDISILLVGFFNGLAAGSGVLFSRYFGAKNEELLHKSIHTAVTFCVILGLIMMTVGIILTPALLRLVKCPDDVYVQAESYLRVYFIGMLFLSLYNVGAGVLRAVGDSRSPFIYLVISSVINVVLNLFFVVVLHLDVLGVAIATVISQLCSVALVLRRLLGTQDVYRLVLKDLKIDRKILVEVIDLGLPSAIQSAIISSSNLFVQRYVNSFGSAAMAGIGAAKKVDKFLMMISQSLNWSTTTFVSQNLGAGKRDRAFSCIRTCLIGGATILIMIGIPVFIFAPEIIELFSTDAAAIVFGVGMVRVMAPFYSVHLVNNVLSGAVRGFGRSRVVMYFSIAGMVVMRQIFLAITMSIDHNVQYVYYGYPFGWTCSAILVVIYYFIVIRKGKDTASVQAAE
ncbi:MAG: MATE family efflux transporter [Clostridia bacterium]|nr:MATE family efflux transporter [Clostridia bacterium]MBR5383902.1 MATE family efflux transporter [Clostridia bacterium]